MQELFYHKNKSLVIPASWEELTPKQFIALSALMHSGMRDADYAFDKALYILSGKWLLKFLLIPADLRYRMHEHITWVFDKITTTKQFIPKYQGLYGPDENFFNLNMVEFHHTETAFYKFTHEEEKEDALNELVAILFRQPRKNYNHKRNAGGDHRIDFTFADIQFHQRKTEKWPVHVKQSILTWYATCRQQLVEYYPTAFDGEPDNSQNYYDGMFGMIRNIAGGKYGDWEKVELMNVHQAFREIVESVQEAKELEAKIKDNKQH